MLLKLQKNIKCNKKKYFIIIFFLIISCLLIFLKKNTNTNEKKIKIIKYEEIINKLDLKKPKTVSDAEKFVIQNNNIYGSLTALILAKKYIASNNLDRAIIPLKNSLKYTKEENLKNILICRIATIKIQQNKNQEAMKMLLNIQNHSWNSIVENIKGDIFMKEKNYIQALSSWKKSKLSEDQNASKEIINMKINNLTKKTST